MWVKVLTSPCLTPVGNPNHRYHKQSFFRKYFLIREFSITLAGILLNKQD